MRNILNRLPGGRFTRSVAILAGGTALGQAITIAAAPVLTRLYTPEDFGVLGVYASLLVILAVVVSLRYEFAIPLPEKDEDGAALVVLSLAIIPATAGALGLALWWFRPEIIHWTNTPALAPYLWLLPVSLIPVGTYQVFNCWAIRKKAFGRIARTKLNQSIASVVTQLALFPLGPLGLLLGYIVSNAAGTSTLTSLAARQDRNAFRAVDHRNVARMAARYRRFPQVSCLSGIVSSGAFQVPVLLLAAFYGPFVAGQFILVQRVVGWPIAILGKVVGQVYFGESASAVRSSPSALRSLFMRASKHLALVAILPMLVLIIFGPWVFPFVFGPDWEKAGQFARILAPLAAVQLVVCPLSHTLNVLERQSWYLAWVVFRLVLVAVCLGFSAYLGWSPVAAVASYGSAMFVGYLILWVLQLVGIGRSINEFRLTSNPSELP